MNIPANDRNILRDLAKKVAEIGNHPIQKQKAQMWTRHNDLERLRPLVLVFPEGSWREMLTDRDLKTTDPSARGLEWELRHRIYYWEHMPDDNVIEPVIASWVVEEDTSRSGYGTG